MEAQVGLEVIASAGRLADDLGLVRDVINVLYDQGRMEVQAGNKESAVRLSAAVQDHLYSVQTRTFSLRSGDEMEQTRYLATTTLRQLAKETVPRSSRRNWSWTQRGS